MYCYVILSHVTILNADSVCYIERGRNINNPQPLTLCYIGVDFSFGGGGGGGVDDRRTIYVRVVDPYYLGAGGTRKT